MEYRTLGRTGFRVSAIGLGCEGFTGKTAKEVRDDFSFALSLGINFFDCYSSDPELRSNFGAALAGRRDQFIICVRHGKTASICARAIWRRRARPLTIFSRG